MIFFEILFQSTKRKGANPIGQKTSWSNTDEDGVGAPLSI